MSPNKGERTKRLQLLLSPDELCAIEDFQFHARMPSLAAAVRELIRRGMVSVKSDQSPQSK